MEKLITVKGFGHASGKPDLVVLSLELETTSLDYDQCVKLSGERDELIKAAVVKSGLPKDSVKTSNFGISSEYRSVKDKNGNYRSVFDCWKCSHELNVKFPLDIKLLTTVLHNIANSKADCKVKVEFTISDSGAIETALLDSAAKDARKKAETLCTALGAKLGELVKIDYSWTEIDIYSHTRYDSGLICGTPAPLCAAPEINPEDVELNDHATFVWQIG